MSVLNTIASYIWLSMYGPIGLHIYSGTDPEINQGGWWLAYMLHGAQVACVILYLEH